MIDANFRCVNTMLGNKQKLHSVFGFTSYYCENIYITFIELRQSFKYVESRCFRINVYKNKVFHKQ